MANLFETGEYLANLVLILFLLINFNLQIGTIYGFMATFDLLAYYFAFDQKVFKWIPIERSRHSRFNSLVWAMGIYVVFMFVVNFITLKFGRQAAASPLENIAQLVSATFSASPILYGSNFLKLAVWGIIIPIVETKAFFRTFLQWGLNFIKMPMPTSIKEPRAWIISAFFGAMFSVFHIAAKGITANSSLMVTFMFGTLSTLMVIHFKEAIQAILLHIITNTIATMGSLKIGFFDSATAGLNISGFMILGGITLAAWVLLFKELPFVKRVSV